MTDVDPRPPAARREGFAAEAGALEGVEATCADTEVTVSVIGDESDASVDLRPVFETAVRYGMVAFDGSAGAKQATLHFKAAERAFRDGTRE